MSGCSWTEQPPVAVVCGPGGRATRAIHATDRTRSAEGDESLSADLAGGATEPFGRVARQLHRTRMPPLPRFTLSPTSLHDWQLTSDDTGEIVSLFATKKQAVRSGVLKKLLGELGGFVSVRRLDGSLDSGRVYPSSHQLSAG